MMINPKELNFGNSVFCKKSKSFCTIAYSHPGYLSVNYDQPGIIAHFIRGDLEDFEAVVISPDRLKSMGFVGSKTSPYKDCDAYVIYEGANRLIWCAGNLFKPTHVSFIKITSYDFLTDPHPIKYIHRLQNAIYFLSGMELKYNPYDPA